MAAGTGRTDPAARWEQPALSTYLYRNHSVRTDAWRYTRYHDGSEELYDERKDPNEWRNLAHESSLQKLKQELARWLPKNDRPDLMPPGKRKTEDE